MNLVKTSIALSMVAAFSAPVMANDEINFYGKANVGIQIADEGDGAFSEVKSNASRLGAAGGLKIDDSLSVVYKVEVQIDMDGESDENVTARNQYVGLKGSFGEVLLGKNDSVMKQSSSKLDIFNDYEADLKVLWKGENRVDESITYKSPKFNNFQLGVTYATESDADQDAGISTALTWGDQKLSKSKYYAAIAADSEIKGYDAVRFTAGAKFGDLKLGAMVHTQENVDTGEELDGFFVSAAYKINDFTIKGQVQTGEVDGGDENTGVTGGVDYALAKNATIFAFYTSFDFDTNGEKDYFATGIEYKF